MSSEAASGLTVVKVESARVRVSNENDADRTADVTAVMEVLGSGVGGISAGQVVKDGVQVASFESYSTDSTHVNFMRSTGRVEVMMAVDAFCEDVRQNGAALMPF